MKFIKKYSIVLSHLGVWLGFLTLWALTVFENPDSEDILTTFITFLPAAYAFYGSNFIFFHFLPRRKTVPFVVAEALFFISCFIFFSLTIHLLRPLAYGTEIILPNTMAAWLRFLANETLWMYLILSTLSLGYYHLRQSGKRAQELKVTQQQKLEAEKGKLEAEYAFLRAQINPHFLHNTLNFFYAKSLGHSAELSEGILTLCEIMRYSLESEEDENGTVLLSKEVEHLHNVIKINQLRFSNRLQIDFHICGVLNGIRIIPLVLITLVENAFKHGELCNAEHPLRFVLEVNEQQQVSFTVQNKKRKGPKEISQGIGLDNTRRRLEAAYPGWHELIIDEIEECYSVSLTIQFHKSEINYTAPTVRVRSTSHTPISFKNDH
ncbi:sensor histidine kinase [Pontibacter silvestris]|uniref:sensor histidine kinase n=1 Tax=Pontibacter silvestris TaxID=2305183 RepID=UPI001E3879C8|nr:histidine kinase [Pontibacter silvestris]MCC9135179.1 histidine kinase [Pontibacter silvestris]